MPLYSTLLDSLFIVHAKVLFQEMWLAGYDWNDAVVGLIASAAQKWFDVYQISQMSKFLAVYSKQISCGCPHFLCLQMHQRKLTGQPVIYGINTVMMKCPAVNSYRTTQSRSVSLKASQILVFI